MAQVAAHLVEHVIPQVPVRQWVLSFPIPLFVAAHPYLLSPVLQVINRPIPRRLFALAGLDCSNGYSTSNTALTAVLN